MDCKYFGECGACREYDGGYTYQLESKTKNIKEMFKPFYTKEITVFSSPSSHYRSRSEFKIWHKEEDIFYAMNHISGSGAVLIDECPQVSTHISALMPKLLEALKEEGITHKLFGADFLSSSTGETVVSLLYHKRLDEKWRQSASKMAKKLNIHVIGRSRGQKEVIGQDYVTEVLNIDNKQYRFMYIENSFTQPNSAVNEKMISWCIANLPPSERDLLELYCGAGNFTIPFAGRFSKVLATEISKSSINAAKANMLLNEVHNIEFLRMDVSDFKDALKGVREFNRMKNVDIGSYEIDTIFVDPPRSGMDEATCSFAARYENILYISCNPHTLARDMEILCKTHEISDMAMFDQFPYTHHAEMGVKFIKKSGT